MSITGNLVGIAAQLRRWAVESQRGGWSTQLVRPMRALANRIDELLAEPDNAAGGSVTRAEMVEALIKADEWMENESGWRFDNGSPISDIVARIKAEEDAP